jgi:hypothetical protein
MWVLSMSGRVPPSPPFVEGVLYSRYPSKVWMFHVSCRAH